MGAYSENYCSVFCHIYHSFGPFLLFQSKEQFIDPDFPPADVSLYIDEKKPVSRWRVYQWQRPEDVVDPHSSRKTKWDVLRNPGPEDIAQGVLGNCW